VRDDRRNYVLVGSFVIAMVVALLVWIALLSGRTGPTDGYYIVYDNVIGLKEGVEILYEGYPVGLIEEIGPIERDGRRRYRVDVSLRRGWPVPVDSRAAITTAGLLSAPVIDVRAGASEALLSPGDEIVGAAATDVFAVVNDVAAQLKPLLMALAEETPEILGNIQGFTESLNATLAQIDAVLHPTNVGHVTSILENLESATAGFSSVVSGLDDTRSQLDGLLLRVGALLDENRGEVGHAVVDLHHTLESVARHIDAVTHNLEVTTRNLNEFSGQLRRNPGVLIRGRESDGDGSGS
jgi:phospholipid/cholesterol/gamma-HCH transport system substrate-binding protein